jgi:hypothetical protein
MKNIAGILGGYNRELAYLWILKNKSKGNGDIKFF